VPDGSFDPNETGTGLTTLFEGDWATVRRLRKGKLVVVGGADQGKMLEIVQETRRFLIITGGGVLLLQKPLREMLDAAELVADRDYFLVDRDRASVLNSVGTLFAVLFMAAKK